MGKIDYCNFKHLFLLFIATGHCVYTLCVKALIINTASHNNALLQGKEEMLTSIPFARPQDTGPSVAIVTKVNRIQDQLVKKHDVELHMHLNRLEIAPQIYGMSVDPHFVSLFLIVMPVTQKHQFPVCVSIQTVGASTFRPRVPSPGPAGGVGRPVCRQHHSGPG